MGSLGGPEWAWGMPGSSLGSWGEPGNGLERSRGALEVQERVLWDPWELPGKSLGFHGGSWLVPGVPWSVPGASLGRLHMLSGRILSFQGQSKKD